MITLREPTSFDAVVPGDVAWVAEKSKNENLEACEIYAQKPYHDIRAQVEISLHSEWVKEPKFRDEKKDRFCVQEW
jgi:hypothetical protein